MRLFDFVNPRHDLYGGVKQVPLFYTKNDRMDGPKPNMDDN